jgi:hypothetical protein
MIAVEVAVDDDWPMFEVDERSSMDHADEVPVTRNPVAVVIVAGYPDVPGTRARRNIGYWPANGDSKLSGLGGVGSKAHSAGNECCT